MTLLGKLGRSGHNLLALSTAELVSRLLGLAYVVALARYLEPGGFGTFSALLAYFALALALGNFGLDRVTLRELAADRAAHGRIFPTLLLLRLGAAAVSALLLLAIGQALGGQSQTLFAVLAVTMFPAAVGSSLTAGFQAREEFGAPSAAMVAGALTMSIMSLAGVALGAPLSFFLWALLFSELARTAWLAVATRTRGFGPWLGLDPALARYAVRAALPYAILVVLGVVYFRIDLVMLHAMAGGAQVGYYAGAYRILEALAIMPALLLGVQFPRFARLLRAQPAQAGALFLCVSRVILWTGLATAVLGAAFAGPVLTTLYGVGYAQARPAMVWLMVSLFFLFWHAPNGTVLFAGDRLAHVVTLSLVAVGFNILANLVLIPRYGAAGAAAATAAAEALAVILFTPFVLRRLSIPGHAYVRALRSPRLARHERDLLLGVDDGAPQAGMARVPLKGVGTA